MSDNTAPAASASAKPPQGPVAKALGTTVAILALIGVVTYLGMSEARDTARTTLQEIFDKDDSLKALKVDSVYLPVQAGLPMAEVLTGLGIVPRKMTGNLMIVRKDGSKMRDGCTYSEYDFNQSNRNGRSYYSIEGMEVAKLRICAGALNGLLGDD
jgi:hypothetical protein